MFSFFEVSSSSKVGVSFTLNASEIVGVYGFTTFTTSVPMLSSFFWEKEIWVKRNAIIINFTCFIFRCCYTEIHRVLFDFFFLRFTEIDIKKTSVYLHFSLCLCEIVLLHRDFFYSVNDEFVFAASPLIMFNSVCASATTSSNSLKFFITLSKIEVALKLSFNW